MWHQYKFVLKLHDYSYKYHKLDFQSFFTNFALITDAALNITNSDMRIGPQPCAILDSYQNTGPRSDAPHRHVSYRSRLLCGKSDSVIRQEVCIAVV